MNNILLRHALLEARQHISAHCECKVINGVRVVWRYQRGKGYVWVPCKACAEFWKAVEELEKASQPTAS